ncbi:GNAT family N-acetyltransferase [Inquilinus sp. KBS0705]|nr:GNAT family N-acetyltransferase [Inquilinus sp. KBS0705]
MRIKRINADEYQTVTALFNQYRMFYRQKDDIALAERFIHERLHNNESVIFVAIAGHNDDIPAGFTQLYPLLSSVRATKNWLLNDLYVDAAFRQQGIGEALIKTAMVFAKDKGAKYLQLETEVNNTTAQSLYENIGFVKQQPDDQHFVYQVNI